MAKTMTATKAPGVKRCPWCGKPPNGDSTWHRGCSRKMEIATVGALIDGDSVHTEGGETHDPLDIVRTQVVKLKAAERETLRRAGVSAKVMKVVNDAARRYEPYDSTGRSSAAQRTSQRTSSTSTRKVRPVGTEHHTPRGTPAIDPEARADDPVVLSDNLTEFKLVMLGEVVSSELDALERMDLSKLTPAARSWYAGKRAALESIRATLES